MYGLNIARAFYKFINSLLFYILWDETKIVRDRELKCFLNQRMNVLNISCWPTWHRISVFAINFILYIIHIFLSGTKHIIWCFHYFNPLLNEHEHCTLKERRRRKRWNNNIVECCVAHVIRIMNKLSYSICHCLPHKFKICMFTASNAWVFHAKPLQTPRTPHQHSTEKLRVWTLEFTFASFMSNRSK